VGLRSRIVSTFMARQPVCLTVQLQEAVTAKDTKSLEDLQPAESFPGRHSVAERAAPNG
jgi:hypothetical protein